MSTAASKDGSVSSMPEGMPGTGHAVVIGAGIAGLAMAKALTAGVGRITVLDRDRVEDGHRRGVPQDRHLHLLLPAGVNALEGLFPGLCDQLIEGGAATGDTDCIRISLNGHRLAPARTGHRAVLASRPFLEALVRRHVHADPRIALRDNTRVAGLTASPGGDRIEGVTLASTRDSPPGVLQAELVVDCSGRRSSLPKWLAALGYDPPEVDELPVEVHYTTLRYRLPDGVLDGDRHVLVGPTPDGPRGGAMTNVEDGSWIVTLFAMAGEQAPADVEDFERFAARLPISDIHEAIRGGQPLDEPAHYRFPANRRHRYERLDALPSGLLAAGDAVCAFNPIYGQGMSIAALEAQLMETQLHAGTRPSPRSWFAAITCVIDTAWELAIGADLAVRAVEGRRGLRTRLVNRYLARLHAAAAQDPWLTARLLRVVGLVDPPTRLLHPTTVAHVLRGRVPTPTAAAATSSSRLA
jgi:2-polyprenyl-6-methoxyphenol hydroxylase-like FAD-dependent oxidoreductase